MGTVFRGSEAQIQSLSREYSTFVLLRAGTLLILALAISESVFFACTGVYKYSAISLLISAFCLFLFVSAIKDVRSARKRLEALRHGVEGKDEAGPK